MRDSFPFTAIVGMARAKRSLICHAIDPHLGGLLLLGHRGCAKSTLARAFAFALPPMKAGTPVPFVEIPLGTTEDRLLGSVDAGSLLEQGKWGARSGLIQQAHQGILYIDEINLLPDSLSDSILDSAASGVHRLERDGISLQVEARFILIGSMNPEEGDLRPQLLDRFCHGVQIHDDFSVEERMAIVERRMAFDDDPAAFVQSYQSTLADLQKHILQARKQLATVQTPHALRLEVAQTAKHLKLEGVRAELATLRTARCLAAWEGRQTVEPKDIEEAWILCLGHRQGQAPPASSPRPQQEEQPPQPPSQPDASRPAPMTTPYAPLGSHPDPLKLDGAQASGGEVLQSWWKQKRFFAGKRPDSNRSASLVTAHRIPPARICWVASLLASVQNGWRSGQGWQVRYRRTPRRANLWIFLDASRSAASLRFLAQARNALLSLKEHTKTHRFQILLLQENQPGWLVKRGTHRQAQQALLDLNEAAGKSYLAQALRHLHSGIQRQGVGAADRVLLCTDGLTSPESGESAQEALQRLRFYLQCLTRFEIPVAWLHPPPKRGLSQWIAKLIENLPIHSLALNPSPQPLLKREDS